MKLGNDSIPRGPKVPRIASPHSTAVFVGFAEWLAGTTSSECFSIARPFGEVEGSAPPADAGEEVMLGVFSYIIWVHLYDTPIVNESVGDLPPPLSSA